MENRAQQLTPGSLFKIGGERFEYQGTAPVENNADGVRIVGRAHPEVPELEGSVHRSFPLEQMQQEAVRVGPFSEVYKFSDYVNEVGAWHTKFGEEIDVPFPPKALVETLKKMKEKGFTNFEPHYLPKIYLDKKDMIVDYTPKPYPDGWKALDTFFHRQVDVGNVRLGTLEREPGWILIDNTPRVSVFRPPNSLLNVPPDFKDPLGPILDTINRDFDTHSESRLGFNERDLVDVIVPYVGVSVGAKKDTVLPSLVEFNVIGNMFHPEWGYDVSYEFLRDEYLVDRYRSAHFVAGYELFGGLSHVDNHEQQNQTPNIIGFRPVVVFENGK